MNLKMGAKPWVAHTQYEYRSMLFTHNQLSTHDKALRLLDLALSTAQELEMKGLERKIKKSLVERREGLRARGWMLGKGAAVEGDSMPVVEESPDSGLHSPAPGAQHPTLTNIFRREGEYWTLAYRGTVSRIKDMKGLHHIAALLRDPGKEFHAAELVTTLSKPPRSVSAAGYASLPEDQLAEYNLSVGGLGDAGTVLDVQATAAYKRRIAELQGEFDEARRFHDAGRATKIRAEIDFLTAELTAALGLSGRARKFACAAERARLNVTKTIRTALKKVSEIDPVLGHHLTTAITTGTFCSYSPDPSHSISWVL
jgi:hypothetical protein